MNSRELNEQLFKNEDFRDYTLEDFKQETLNRRKEILSVSANYIPRTLTLLSMKSGKTYYAPSELYADILGYISFGVWLRGKKKYGNPFPSPDACWQYIKESESTIGFGILTKMKMVARVGDDGYKLTSFGEIIKGFITYLLKKCAEIYINPEILGSSTEVEGKRGCIGTIDIIELLSKNKEGITLSDIRKYAEQNYLSIYSRLQRLNKYGLVECISAAQLEGKTKIYRVNKQNVEKFMSLNIEEMKEEFRKIHPRFPKRIPIPKILQYLLERDYVSKHDISEKFKISETGALIILRTFKELELIEEERPKYKLTEMGSKVYEEIILPIQEVARDPNRIKDYIDYKDRLSDEEKLKLLEIYSKARNSRGSGKKIVYQVIKGEREGVTVKEIMERTKLGSFMIRKYCRELMEKGLIHTDGKEKYWASR